MTGTVSFCPGYQTQTELIALMDNLQRHLDRGRSVLLLLLILTVVFHMVDYELMTHHLTNRGIRGDSHAMAYLLSPWAGTDSGAWEEGFFELSSGIWYP